MEKSSALKYVSQMKPKEHAIMFYLAPADKRLVLFTYLKAGLDQGETSAYVACEESPDHIMDAMVRFGIDVKRLEKKEALCMIHLRNWYIVEGEFSISRTIERWKELYDKSTVKGFKGLESHVKRYASSRTRWLMNSLSTKRPFTGFLSFR